MSRFKSQSGFRGARLVKSWREGLNRFKEIYGALEVETYKRRGESAYQLLDFYSLVFPLELLLDMILNLTGSSLWKNPRGQGLILGPITPENGPERTKSVRSRLLYNNYYV